MEDGAARYGTPQLCGHPASTHFQSPQPANQQVSNPKITQDMIVAQARSHRESPPMMGPTRWIRPIPGR